MFSGSVPRVGKAGKPPTSEHWAEGVNSKVKHDVSKAAGRKQYVEVIEPRKIKMGLDDVIALTEINTGNGAVQVIFCTPGS